MVILHHVATCGGGSAHGKACCLLQPRLVHVNAATRAVENISFLHCPAERRVQVDVPVRVSLTFVALIVITKKRMCWQRSQGRWAPVTHQVPAAV